MSNQPRWRYVQARLQARHGERLTEDDWRALEAAQSFDHYLDRARATPLRRFVDRLNAAMTSHAIERHLGAAWRDYVAEIATWLDRDWQAATQWTALAPDLPALAALLRDDIPVWLKHDTRWADFTEGDIPQRLARLEKSPFAPLLPTSDHASSLATRWTAHWRSLWPTPDRTDIRALSALMQLIIDHHAQLTASLPPDTSAPHRLDLARAVTRLFRRHGASPVAVFSHLVLVALDLERLRGGLSRRRLFTPARAQEAA
ncbi:MAG: hypothetical protein GC182_16335 [Rhodopseudomonas sp.]|nr:hypothetical protein [Rhodopseudomonas sp.]